MRIQSEHLDNTNQSYFEHASGALGISFGLFTTSLKMFVHAAIPDYFSTSATDYANELLKQSKNEQELKEQENNLDCENHPFNRLFSQ